jgi:tetratricopeptide (TPR) repeat protein
LDPTPERKAKAEAELDTILKMAPDAPESHFAQGSFKYECVNDWAGALQEFLAAEPSLPNDAELQFRIGTSLRRLGRLQEALARFERAAELNPNDNFVILSLLDTVDALREYPKVIELDNRYDPAHSKDFSFEYSRIAAQYEIDGNRAEFLRALSSLTLPTTIDPTGKLKEVDAALRSGDLAAAAQALSDPRLVWSLGGGGTINEPIEQIRALVACLRGRQDDARQFADQAIAIYRRNKWVPRGSAWVRMGIASSEAFEGLEDEAVRDGKAALDDELTRDQYDGVNMKAAYGEILVLAGRRDEALSVLGELMTQPAGGSANDYRYDPVWMRLKDDPRFEQVLQSVKTF